MKFCSCHICHVFFYSNCSGVATFVILGRICQQSLRSKNALYCLTYCVVGGLHNLFRLWILLGVLNKVLNVEIV